MWLDLKRTQTDLRAALAFLGSIFFRCEPTSNALSFA